MKHLLLLSLVISAVGCNQKSSVSSSGVEANTIETFVNRNPLEVGLKCEFNGSLLLQNEKKDVFIRGMGTQHVTLHDVNGNIAYEETFEIAGRPLPAFKFKKNDDGFSKNEATQAVARGGVLMENEDDSENPIWRIDYKLTVPVKSVKAGELYRYKFLRFPTKLQDRVDKNRQDAELLGDTTDCEAVELEAPSKK